jgi:hypothetical protein
MTELEERLRNTLREAAGTVPRSPHARADFERRLARRRTTRFRTSLLATAAAAVVMVGVAIPVVMNSDDDPAQGHATQLPIPTTSDTSESTPGTTGGPPAGKDGYLFAGPVELGSFVEEGQERTALLTVEQNGDGERMCLMVRPSTGSKAPGTGCEPVPTTWPTRPEGTGYVETRAVLGGETLDSGPLPELMLFMAAPVVTTLEVHDGASSPVLVNLVAVSPGARFYLADFNGSSQGFGYTAKDNAGKIIETAIT